MTESIESYLFFYQIRLMEMTIFTAYIGMMGEYHLEFFVSFFEVPKKTAIRISNLGVYMAVLWMIVPAQFM